MTPASGPFKHSTAPRSMVVLSPSTRRASVLRDKAAVEAAATAAGEAVAAAVAVVAEAAADMAAAGIIERVLIRTVAG